MEHVPVSGAAEYVRKFQSICAKHGMTPAQGCLSFVKANCMIDYIVLGVESIKELDVNINALKQPVNTSLITDVYANIDCGDERVLVPSQWRKE